MVPESEISKSVTNKSGLNGKIYITLATNSTANLTHCVNDKKERQETLG